MSGIFISYARSTEAEAQRIEEALRRLGHEVWRDDQIGAHQAFGKVLEERLAAAKAVLVLWSADAAASEWVRSEASRARAMGKLVQLTLDRSPLPMPFDQIQCADLSGWNGAPETSGWRKVIASIGELIGAGATGGAAPRTTSSPILPGKPSIAVLPFANLSGDPKQDYFADGMVEEIASALSRFKSLFVIAGRSGLSFKGQGTSSQDAAGTLGVRYVLEGSVRKAGGRVRVAVKLIDGESGAQVWSDRFDDTLEDVFALQDRVAQAVAGVIAPAVREAETRRAISRPTSNPTSYDLFLRGFARYRAFTKDDLVAAIALFEAAIALDPEFAEAMAFSATCHALISTFGWAEDSESHRTETVQQIRRAIERAGDDSDALAMAASAALLGGDITASGALAARAVALNPGSSIARSANAWGRLVRGEISDALTECETALHLDPLSSDRPFYLGTQGAALVGLGRFEEALGALNESRRLRSDWPLTHFLAAVCEGWIGDGPAASEALAAYRAVTPVPISVFLDLMPWPETYLASLRNGLARAEGYGPSDPGGADV